jgi:hypothetical protein
VTRKYFRYGRRARHRGRAAPDGGFRAAARERRGPRAGPQGRHRTDRQGHAVVGLHVRGGAGSGFRGRGRGCACSSARCPRRALPISREVRLRGGVVISASHNLYEDNGIKFFDGNGGKLTDELEEKIERQLTNGAPVTQHVAGARPRPRVDKSRSSTRSSAPRRCPQGSTLDGLEDRDRLRQRRGLQGGAPHPGGPGRRDRADRLLAERQATSMMAAAPRTPGTCCSSPWPGVKAQVGIALDGDGDRLVMVDHLGRIVDGDQLLYVIAKGRHAEASPCSCPVVGTVMSNLGLEHALREAGHRLPPGQGRRSLCARAAA